jgi:hypothetical protein
LRSDNDRGDLAAWILDEEIEIRVWQSVTVAYILSKVQLALDDCVDVLPAHVVCLADCFEKPARMCKVLVKVTVGFVPPRTWTVLPSEHGSERME